MPHSRFIPFEMGISINEGTPIAWRLIIDNAPQQIYPIRNGISINESTPIAWRLIIDNAPQQIYPIQNGISINEGTPIAWRLIIDNAPQQIYPIRNGISINEGTPIAWRLIIDNAPQQIYPIRNGISINEGTPIAWRLIIDNGTSFHKMDDWWGLPPFWQASGSGTAGTNWIFLQPSLAGSLLQCQLKWTSQSSGEPWSWVSLGVASVAVESLKLAIFSFGQSVWSLHWRDGWETSSVKSS